jgi:hypothetical protein
VFREESYPSSAALEEDAFDEDTIRAAVDAVSKLVNLLQPHVDDRQFERGTRVGVAGLRGICYTLTRVSPPSPLPCRGLAPPSRG